MVALQVMSLLLLIFLSKDTSEAKVPRDAISLARCIEISSTLAKSLKNTLLGLQEQKNPEPKKKPIGIDCLDLYEKGERKNGVYDIYKGSEKIKVYCDMTTDGGGWTVIQRRVNALVDFYRKFDDYITGFGDLSGSFWLGLENIYKLTSVDGIKSSLRVDMWVPKEHRYEKYGVFKLAVKGWKYKLTIDNATGTAGDSLGAQNGFPFTTKDSDYDNWWDGNCAERFKGGWWYASCYKSNLNGLYLNGENDKGETGIIWSSWKGTKYSLQKVEMKIRRNK